MIAVTVTVLAFNSIWNYQEKRREISLDALAAREKMVKGTVKPEGEYQDKRGGISLEARVSREKTINGTVELEGECRGKRGEFPLEAQVSGEGMIYGTVEPEGEVRISKEMFRFKYKLARKNGQEYGVARARMPGQSRETPLEAPADGEGTVMGLVKPDQECLPFESSLAGRVGGDVTYLSPF